MEVDSRHHSPRAPGRDETLSDLRTQPLSLAVSRECSKCGATARSSSRCAMRMGADAQLKMRTHRSPSKDVPLPPPPVRYVASTPRTHSRARSGAKHVCKQLRCSSHLSLLMHRHPPMPRGEPRRCPRVDFARWPTQCSTLSKTAPPKHTHTNTDTHGTCTLRRGRGSVVGGPWMRGRWGKPRARGLGA